MIVIFFSSILLRKVNFSDKVVRSQGANSFFEEFEFISLPLWPGTHYVGSIQVYIMYTLKTNKDIADVILAVYAYFFSIAS